MIDSFRIVSWLALLGFLATVPRVAFAGYGQPTAIPAAVSPDSPNVLQPILREVGFDQKLDKSVDKSLTFTDDTGKPVKLGDYFSTGKPVILGMVYFGCPNLCTLVMNGVFKAMQELPFSVGESYSMVLVSIDPTEDFNLAAKKKRTYLKKFTKSGPEQAVHFLTGRQAEITKLAEEIGFRYKYDEKAHQYAHPSGVVVLTPEGKISRYLYGIEYPGKDLRLALVEASRNQIGKVTDQFLLFCYHYDPAVGGYTFMVMKVLRGLGILTIALLGFFVYWMSRQARRKKLVESWNT